MKPLEIADGIYWVGAIDWDIKEFHGYNTSMGTTYNAYLIMDEKITLIDAVKKEFSDELINCISQIVDPKKIDYVISNHTEMDHSGGLARVMHRIGEDKPLFCSKMGYKALPQHFPQKWNYKPVEEGERLSLGKRSLTFIETRMLHWPDSMFTYINEDKILFSSDGFGQHYAGLERFEDQIGDDVMTHAKAYFANILLLYSPKILKLIDKITKTGLSFNMICPDHGLIWRNNPSRIIQAYEQWSVQTPKRKALVVYDTMWSSTKKMAEALVDAMDREGVDARPRRLKSYHRSDIITELIDAGAILIGSPTLNNHLYPTVMDFITYMSGLKPKNKIGVAFGSYGWSGEMVGMINSEFEKLKFDIIDPGLKVKYVPDDKDIEACYALGKKVASKLPQQ